MTKDRRLILMRHAKSAWHSDAVNDHERPLNARGLRDAPRIGRRLMSMGWLPDRVVVSDATRTRQTYVHLFEDTADRPPEVLEPRLYLGGTDEIRDALLEQDDTDDTLMVLGHNPGWEDALLWFAGVRERLTTANAALLRSTAASWSEAVARPERFDLMAILRPKDLSD